MKFILLACILSFTVLIDFCSTSPIPSTSTDAEVVLLEKRTSRKKYVVDCPTPNGGSGGSGGVYKPPGGSIGVYGSPNAKVDSDKLTKKLKKLIDKGLLQGYGVPAGTSIPPGAVSNALGGSASTTTTTAAAAVAAPMPTGMSTPSGAIAAPMPSSTPTPAGTIADSSRPVY